MFLLSVAAQCPPRCSTARITDFLDFTFNCWCRLTLQRSHHFSGSVERYLEQGQG